MSNPENAGRRPIAHPFGQFDEIYEALGDATTPVAGKRPVISGWENRNVSKQDRAERRTKFASCGIGFLAGTELPDGSILGYFDVDSEAWLPFIFELLGQCPSAKKGSKGATIFTRFKRGCESSKWRAPGESKPAVEINVQTGQTVLPPSMHPNGQQYEWIGEPLYETDRANLPLISPELLSIGRAVISNESANAILSGGPDVGAHDHMLRLTGSGIANLTEDLVWLARCLNAIFHPQYRGNTPDETLEMLESAKRKGLGTGSKDAKTDSPSIMDLFADDEIETFHAEGPVPYVTVSGPSGGRFSYPVRSSQFGLWIKRKYFQLVGKPIPTAKFDSLIDLFEAKSLFGSPKQDVFLRKAELAGEVYIDLGDALGRVVKITADGWSVESSTPVKFRRSTAMRALPVPVAGGSIHSLNDILKLSHENWVCVVAFILNCLNPNGPYFLLLIEAEQGSGKSFLASVLKSLIDPSALARARLPESEHDLIIQAKEADLLNFDNTSYISNRISDALCSLATGSAFGTRKYYTDDELRLITACRPFILNGIGEYARRPDLLNRAIPLRLPSFSGSRRSEEELRAEFDEMAPQLLGSLYSIVSHALKFRNNVDPPQFIRMADAARWLLAAEAACGFPEGTFAEVLGNSQEELIADVIINDPVAVALSTLIDGGAFDGRMGPLHTRLNELGNGKGLPTTPAHLSTYLKRIGPALRTIGIRVEFGPKSQKGRTLRIWRDAPSNPSGPKHSY